MANHTPFSIKPVVSSTRIIFGLLPGLGAMILLRMVIHLYRPDIEDADHRVKDHPFDELYEYYDFIVIGAGSAGSVVASRLSENQNWNILLLEAGQDENVLSDVPILFPTLQTSAIDWQFVTEPSGSYCLSMIDNRCKWPRGKVLGGSSAINAMLYIRGNKKDYDNWESLGNPGWAYKDIIKYFLKSEDMRIPEYQDDPYHSTGGPMSVEYFGYEQPITNKVLQAGLQLGYNVLDVNGEFQTGFTKSHATLRDGLRCSTAKGYLRPASKRPNLHVSVHSLVEKIIIDEFKAAYGVKFSKHGKTRIIKSSKEIIVSAGAIQSPQLLMLSGLGDSTHLKELGIFPIVHLPGVGKNLQDHVAMGGHSFLFDNPYNNGSDYCFNLNTIMSISSLIDFGVNKNGPLYSMMEAEAMAFVNTKYQDPLEDHPDIQFFIASTADNMDGGLFGKRANGLSDETYAELYEDILYESSFSIVPLLLRPKSRGSIKLRDANPYSPPFIYPNYYSEPDDLLRMIDGARIAQMLVEQPALQELNARPNPNRNPGCLEHSLMSDEHLECQARHHSLTIYHPVGTCAMGPVNNFNAVVDARLRVYGVKNLRVVDGSIMPTIVSGNTNAPIIMIAEKASDIIKEDWAADNFIFNDISSLKNMEFRISEDIVLKPDVFSEVTSLFPHLSKDITHKYDALKNKVVINNLGTSVKQKQEKITDLRDFYNSTPTKYIANITKSANSHQTTPINYLFHQPQSNIISKSLLKPYPYNTDNNKIELTLKNSGTSKAKMPKHSTEPIYSYPKMNDIYTTNEQVTFNQEWNLAANSQYKHEVKQKPSFYRRLIPGEDKRCRTWLYYNGLKYIIEL